MKKEILLCFLVLILASCKGGSGGAGSASTLFTDCSVSDANLNGVSFDNSDSTVEGTRKGTNIAECLLAQYACNFNYELSVDQKSCESAPTPVTINNPILEYTVMNNTPANIVSGSGVMPPEFSQAYPTGVGQTSTGSGQSPAISGVAALGSGSSRTIPSSFKPIYNALLPSVSGEQAGPITSCTLEALTIMNCTITTNTFEVLVTPTDLDNLSSTTLDVDSHRGKVPVKKTTLQPYTDAGCWIKYLAKFEGEHYFSGCSQIYKKSITGEIVLITNMGNVIGDRAYVTSNGLYYAILDSSFLSIFKISKNGSVKKVYNLARKDYDDNLKAGIVYNDELYFYGVTNHNSLLRMKLLKIDATDTVIQVSNTTGAQNTDDNSWLPIIFNGSLYFSSNNSSNRSKLYKLAANGAITQVSNLLNDQLQHDHIVEKIVFNNKLYFNARNSNNVDKIFSLDVNDVMSQVSNTSGIQTTNDGANGFKILGDEMYFLAYEGGTRTKLYKMDKNEVITKISNLSNGVADGVYTPRMTKIGTNIYFEDMVGAGVNKLHRLESNGTITQIASLSGSQSTTDNVYIIGETGDNLWLGGVNSSGKVKLYRYNVKTDVVSLVANVSGNNNIDEYPSLLIIMDNELLINIYSQAYKIIQN